MAQENVEIVRSMVEAWKGSSPEGAFAYMHPEVEYDVTVRPDGKVWHGHDGVRRSMIEWVGTWNDLSLDVDGYFDLGDDRVAFTWAETARAKASGVPMSQDGVSLVTLRDGLIVSVVVSVDRKRSLAALGLPP